MSSGNSQQINLSSSLGPSSSTSFKHNHKKITSHTISISGKQDASLTKSHGPSSSNSLARSSLLPSNNLSKATGVGHLNDKQSALSNGVLNYLQKSQNLSSSINGSTRQSKNALGSKAASSASNAIDYYTVQNTRNGSIQNSSQQTSRNQNHLATQQIKNNNAGALISADQDSISLGLGSSTMQEGANSSSILNAGLGGNANNHSSSLIAGLSTPALLANRSMRSPPRTSVINQPLKQINEKSKGSVPSNNGGASGSTTNHNNTSQTITDFSKMLSNSQVNGKLSNAIGVTNPATSSKQGLGNRHSVITGERNLGGYPRATSVVKNNLLQKNFSQMSSLSKSQNQKKLNQMTNSINSNNCAAVNAALQPSESSITSTSIPNATIVVNNQSGGNQKGSHKKSMILQTHKEQQSPKLGFDLAKHALFKSPQIARKTEKEMSELRNPLNTSSTQNIKGQTLSGMSSNNVPTIEFSSSNSPMPQPAANSNYHKKIVTSSNGLIINRTSDPKQPQNTKAVSESIVDPFKSISQTRKVSNASQSNPQNKLTKSGHNPNATSQSGKPPSGQPTNGTIVVSSSRPLHNQIAQMFPSNSNAGATSCLQIDLSMLSAKPEEDPSLSYNAAKNGSSSNLGTHKNSISGVTNPNYNKSLTASSNLDVSKGNVSGTNSSAQIEKIPPQSSAHNLNQLEVKASSGAANSSHLFHGQSSNSHKSSQRKQTSVSQSGKNNQSQTSKVLSSSPQVHKAGAFTSKSPKHTKTSQQTAYSAQGMIQAQQNLAQTRHSVLTHSTNNQGTTSSGNGGKSNNNKFLEPLLQSQKSTTQKITNKSYLNSGSTTGKAATNSSTIKSSLPFEKKNPTSDRLASVDQSQDPSQGSSVFEIKNVIVSSKVKMAQQSQQQRGSIIQKQAANSSSSKNKHNKHNASSSNLALNTSGNNLNDSISGPIGSGSVQLNLPSSTLNDYGSPQLNKAKQTVHSKEQVPQKQMIEDDTFSFNSGNPVHNENFLQIDLDVQMGSSIAECRDEVSDKPLRLSDLQQPVSQQQLNTSSSNSKPKTSVTKTVNLEELKKSPTKQSNQLQGSQVQKKHSTGVSPQKNTGITSKTQKVNLEEEVAQQIATVTSENGGSSTIMQVSDEKSNLKTQKSQSLLPQLNSQSNAAKLSSNQLQEVLTTQAITSASPPKTSFIQQPNQLSNSKTQGSGKKTSLINQQKKLSKIGSNPKIHLKLDESYEENHSAPLKQIFLRDSGPLLFDYEKREIRELKEERIYFPGILFKDRTLEDIATSRKLQSEAEMLKSLDDEEGYYNVVLNDHLNYRFEILKILGKGSFAQVVCALDHKTNQRVAVKITRNTEIDHKFASSESKLLNFLMQNDPNDEHNVVRLKDEFYFRDHHCFVFELLNTDLFEHLRENGFIGFEVVKIRDYAVQILEALVYLEKHQIIHCDLKPENILLCDEECRKLKLVDYGSGCFRSEQVYTYVQSRFYRAPEVILRIPYSEKVDIWSFGCILAELYTGEPLFPGNNEQEQLELIMEVCGIPTEKVIDQSRKKEHYFDVDYSPFLIEDEELGIMRIPESRRLEDAVPCQDEMFLDFIRKCLELDPELRFSASRALKHPWIEDGLVLRQDSLQSFHSVNTVNTNKTSKTINGSLTVGTATAQANGMGAPTFESAVGGQLPRRQPSQKNESSHNLQIPAQNRRREDQQDGVKGIIYEESPQRPIKDQPKKSLTKHFNFQAQKVPGAPETDSLISTPKNEGGIRDTEGSALSNSDTRPRDYISVNALNDQEMIKGFDSSVQREQIINEEEISKPHNASMVNKNINTEKITVAYNSQPNPPLQKGSSGGSSSGVQVYSKEQGSAGKVDKSSYLSQNKKQNQVTSSGPGGVGNSQPQSNGVKMIGKYEITKEDEEKAAAKINGTATVPGTVPGIETNSQTSGIATEANIPPVNQHHEGNLINNENSINKITVTFYQKRASTNKPASSQQQQKQLQLSQTQKIGAQQSSGSSNSLQKSPLKSSSTLDHHSSTSHHHAPLSKR